MNAPRLRDSDLYLVLEVRHAEARSSVADEAARKLGYSVAFAAAGPGIYDPGACHCKPLSDKGRPDQASQSVRSSLPFTKPLCYGSHQTPWGDLRVWNVHLDTRINPQERVDQLQPVMDDAALHSGRQLIGGDFNTNDLYWLGNALPLPFGPAHSTAIRSAMKQNGFETPFPNAMDTFAPFRRHLDWIFVSKLKSLAASVEPAPFSDHNAIWVRVRL